MTDKDWTDARFRLMDTGPFFDCTMRYPLGKGQETVYKATVVKLGAKGDAGAVFDRNTLRLSAAWTGGFLNHSDRPFRPDQHADAERRDALRYPHWAGVGRPERQVGREREAVHGPAAKGVGEVPRVVPARRSGGLLVHRRRARLCWKLSHQTLGGIPGGRLCVRRKRPWTRFVSEPSELTRYLTDLVKAGMIHHPRRERAIRFDSSSRPAPGKGSVTRLGSATTGAVDSSIGIGRSRVIRNRPQAVPVRLTVGVADIAAEGHEGRHHSPLETPRPASTSRQLTKEAGPKRWGEPLVTKLERGSEDGPFAVDTLTIPYKNRFDALFFCTGLDFLKDGRIAVCTCHGDVWLVTVNEKAGTCSWQRYATGLYHPLGLKVVDGKIVVLERGQLTRLHDLNDDGEADFYECVNNDWHTGAGEHSYDTCLETDPQGNFYFFKTGDTETPTGGCLIKVSKDGSKSEIFCTGFRHPIGLGMSPSGLLTGADQEGNWMPATRIDEYKKGGFYGDMRAHHRATPPATYDPPLCWLPREIDNSAGGQVWVPKGEPGASATGGWDALAGLPLHFSYGRCKAFVLLRQELSEGRAQGGAAPLGVSFLSGVCRGRFHTDGHLYVCGLNGWQTAAQADGCLQRVRTTGKPFDLPTAMEVTGNTIRLTFSRPLDPKAIAAPENYRAARWNYRWSGEYGSKRWKVSDPSAEGQDDVPVRSAKLSADGRTLELTFESVKPAMQMMVGYNVKSADGKPVVGSVYLTVHTTGK